MNDIVGIAGSLRERSYNRALLRAAAAAAPPGTTVDIRTIEGIPLYNADEEASGGVPAPVAALQDRIAAAGGLLIVTPEYNNGVPGVLKNAIDWLSRPSKEIDRVFRHCPVGIIGATPGGFGTANSQNAWLPVLRHLGMRPWYGARVLLSGASKAFDQDGGLVDEGMREQLREYMQGFAAFVADCHRGRGRAG